MILRAIAVAFLAVSVTACDQFLPRNVNTAESTESVSSIGTVREIDRVNRRFQLRIDDRTLTLRANEAAAAFDVMEVGDRIRVTYRRAIAVDMVPPEVEGDTRRASGTGFVVGERSVGRAGGRIVQGVVEFVSFDPDTNRATLIDPNGFDFDVEVPAELRAFARSRAQGDRIMVTYAEGIAIELEFADAT